MSHPCGDALRVVRSAALEQDSEEEEHCYREEYVPPLRLRPASEERLLSFGLSRFHPCDHAADDAAAAVAELERNHVQKQ